MRSREEIYEKLIKMNEHKDELIHFLNNPPNGGLWGISEKHHQFETQCSMVDLLEWVLNIKNQNKDEEN